MTVALADNTFFIVPIDGILDSRNPDGDVGVGISVTPLASDPPGYDPEGYYSGFGIDPNGFLADDSDPQGDPLSYTIVSAPTHGGFTPLIGGSFLYTPDPGYTGPDEFTYELWGGGEKDLENITETFTVS